jgi:DNA-binding NtrC family response regulator
MIEKVLIVEDQFVEANYLRSMLERVGYHVCGIARSVEKAIELIRQERPGLVLLDIFLSGKKTGIDLAFQLREDNIAFVYLSASSNENVLTSAKATHPYGFLVKPFRERDLLITLEIARYLHEHSIESGLRKETALQKYLAGVVAEPSGREQKIFKIIRSLQTYFPFDFITTDFNSNKDASDQGLNLLRVGFEEYQVIGIKELSIISGLTTKQVTEMVNEETTPVTGWYNEPEFEILCRKSSVNKLFTESFQLKSYLSLQFTLTDAGNFGIGFYTRRPDAYSEDHIILFRRLQQILTKSFESIVNNGGKIINHKTKNFDPNISVESSKHSPGFEGIVGKSHLLLNVFDQITQVAAADTSVLILGESGTGKERIADCIHNLSTRKGRPFIRVNCAALPATLIESELFGHEKGSFTGALDLRIGKFELADKGTIFLDEIGEMPLEIQAKFLRVLQEKEIERIGSKSPAKVNIRIIAATNRNLEKEVAEGRFRLDLYYRLNVFPISLPSLRERTEDIPALAWHFLNYYNRKSGKKVTGISDIVLKRMMAYSWPGNIRELEHLIERCILLAKGTTIDDLPLNSLAFKEIFMGSEETQTKTIHQQERDYIIQVLRKCNGRIWGPGGAAEIMDIPPSTLKSKMKKLNIKKDF